MAINQNTIKQINTHIYALDLKKIQYAFDTHTSSTTEKKESFKNLVKIYCDSNNIDFSTSNSVVITPSQKLKESNQIYLKFLEQYLTVIDIKIITSFLDYQLKQFKYKNAKINFIASVNSTILPFIRIDSTTEGILRLDEIKKWYEKNEAKYKVHRKPLVIKKFVAEKQYWEAIKNISVGLFHIKVISNQTDFKKMVINGEHICVNNKKVIILAFVIKLLHNKYQLISVQGAKKGAYFSVLNSLLKSNGGSTYASKYIDNYILAIKKKNPQIVLDANQDADEIISEYASDFIKKKRKKQDQ